MSPFAVVTNFLNSWVGDILGLATVIFAIGLMVCAIGVWQGSEEAVPKFKKHITWIFIAFVVCLLATGIITWVKSGISA